jgi:hypothetical protein
MTGAEYQETFDREAERDYYPARVEGRSTSSGERYRAEFQPLALPKNGFYSLHGVSAARYQQMRDELGARGFSEVWVQTFVDDQGNRRYQATWLPRGSASPAP